jgi:hypothetical protein
VQSLSELDFPIEKKPRPEEVPDVPPPPDYPPSPPLPPSPPPLSSQTVNKFICQMCGKTFTTKEELAMHTITEHQSPKKKA